MTKRTARIIGVVYLLFFLTSILSDGLLKRVVVHDAAATATNILTHKSLFLLGIATGLVETGFYVALTALFYNLFKPVNRRISLVAAFRWRYIYSAATRSREVGDWQSSRQRC